MLVLVLLAGCASPPAPSQPGVPRPAADAGTPPRPLSLESERHWLQSWFAGTPVQIALRSDGALAVEVPREFCFDAGRSAVKPALAAVLDKVAESLRRQRTARLTLLAAPGDPAPNAGLARQRAEQVRTHLRGRGVPESRLAASSNAVAAAVQLRLELPAP
jgi:outer membrane protein OmpA-like peptidoglycan-associated protein